MANEMYDPWAEYTPIFEEAKRAAAPFAANAVTPEGYYNPTATKSTTAAEGMKGPNIFINNAPPEGRSATYNAAMGNNPPPEFPRNVFAAGTPPETRSAVYHTGMGNTEHYIPGMGPEKIPEAVGPAPGGHTWSSFYNAAVQPEVIPLPQGAIYSGMGNAPELRWGDLARDAWNAMRSVGGGLYSWAMGGRTNPPSAVATPPPTSAVAPGRTVYDVSGPRYVDRPNPAIYPGETTPHYNNEVPPTRAGVREFWGPGPTPENTIVGYAGGNPNMPIYANGRVGVPSATGYMGTPTATGAGISPTTAGYGTRPQSFEEMLMQTRAALGAMGVPEGTGVVTTAKEGSSPVIGWRYNPVGQRRFDRWANARMGPGSYDNPTPGWEPVHLGDLRGGVRGEKVPGINEMMAHGVPQFMTSAAHLQGLREHEAGETERAHIIGKYAIEKADRIFGGGRNKIEEERYKKFAEYATMFPNAKKEELDRVWQILEPPRNTTGLGPVALKHGQQVPKVVDGKTVIWVYDDKKKMIVPPEQLSP